MVGAMVRACLGCLGCKLFGKILVVTIHLEKYESQWEGLSHILLKLKNGPNHQPDMLMMVNDG